MNNQLHKILLKISTAIFVFAFFIGKHFLDYSLALFLLSLVFYSVKEKNFHFSNNKTLLFLIIFYFIHFIAVFYSDNKKAAYFDLEVKASILVFGLFFLFASKTAIEIKKFIFKFFIILSSAVSLFLIIRALIIFIKTNDSSQLFYSNFSYFLHPSYYAMYLIFSMILSFYLLKEKSCKSNLIPVVSILINFIALVMSDSKSGYISFAFIAIFLIIKTLYIKSKKATIFGIIFIIIISIFAIKQNTRLNTMFNVVKNYKETIENPNTYKESTGLRILSWNATIRLIKENPVFGVGTGDIKPVLFKKYKKLNYTHNLEIEMNVHNQFLETWLGQGIIALFLLLMIFILPFITAIKQKDIILQAFLILVFINFLFESMLNTQAGTIFFGFFYSFLISITQPENLVQNQN